MKKVFQFIFWVFSAAILLFALALFSASAFSGVLLIACAVVINPILIERIQLKKGLTALLAIGLFVASIAVFPAKTQTVAQDVDETSAVVREAPVKTTDRSETGASRSIDDAKPSTDEQDVSSLTLAALAAAQTDPATEKPSIAPTNTPSTTPTIAPFATPTQTLTATPIPTPTFTVTPVMRSTRIMIMEYSDATRRGSYAYIKIQGAPNTDYTCQVQYKTTMSSADGLGKKRSDANGYVSWRWKVGSRTSLDYRPTIYIDGGGDSVSVRFSVTG